MVNYKRLLNRAIINRQQSESGGYVTPGGHAGSTGGHRVIERVGLLNRVMLSLGSLGGVIMV